MAQCLAGLRDVHVAREVAHQIQRGVWSIEY